MLVSAARVLQAVIPDGLSPERNAGRIEAQRDFVVRLIDALVARARRASDEDAADRARQRLVNRLDQWVGRRKHLADLRKTLVYERVTDDTKLRRADDERGERPGAVGRSGRPAVRGRQLHARGAAGDQPPGQPDQGQPDLHRAARRAAVGVPPRRCASERAAEFLYDGSRAVDPLGDADRENAKSAKHNRAKVGSSRPSTLLYTYGPGAIMDLPQFTIMPTGLDDWDRIWNRREGPAADPRAAAAGRGPDAPALPRRPASPAPVAAEADQLQQRGQRPRRPVPRVPAVAALHRVRHARPAVAVRLHQHPPVPHRPGLLRARQVHRAAESPAQGGPPPRGAGPVPARLRGRATWTSSPTTCGSTTARRARRPSSRSCG